MKLFLTISLLTFALLKSCFSNRNRYNNLIECNSLLTEDDVGLNEEQYLKIFNDKKSLYLPHMLEVNWNYSSGWDTPRINSMHSLQIHPASKVINRAQELFDSLEAVRDNHGKIRTFRIEDHLSRLAKSASALALPSFDSKDLVNCVKQLLRKNKFYIQSNLSEIISVRSILIGTEGNVQIETPDEALLYVIGIRAKFPTVKPKPISIYIDPRYTRSWFGWIAKHKTSAIYSSSFYLKKVAKSKGFDSILWLFNGTLLTEGDQSNLFVVFNTSSDIRELVTPLANDLIYNGITRTTILELAKNWPDVRVIERDITIDEIFKASRNKCLLELFFSSSSKHAFPANVIYNALTNQTIFIPEYSKPIYSRINQYYTDLFSTNSYVNNSWIRVFE